MKIEILGSPIPKARHRSFSKHGRIVSYDPQDKEKKAVSLLMATKLRELFNSQDKGKVMEASNLASSAFFEVEMYFGIPYPRKRNTRQINSVLWGFQEPISKPDLDNLVKFYMDAANGVLWPDDRMIVSLKTTKRFSIKPKVVIKIKGQCKGILKEDLMHTLETYSPDDVYDLITKTKELDENYKKFYQCDDENFQNNREVFSKRIAIILNEIAEKHANLLMKIKKNKQQFNDLITQIEKKSVANLPKQ